jgi:cytochrome c553
LGAWGAGEPAAPGTLAATGLVGEAVPGLSRYAPVYPLWTDGAAKRRWVSLPAGASIDASRPGAWVFPAGTRFWKEFAFGGRKVETRYMEKRQDGTWLYAAYVWNEAQTEATLAPAGGLRDHADVGEGVRHDIPGVADCGVCHEAAGRDAVLGFSAVQLSPERDPLAPHAEPFDPGMLDLDALVAAGRLSPAPADGAAAAGIAARTPRERAALGYLHANCGGCHHRDDEAASAGLWLRVAPGDAPGAHDVLRTALGQASASPVEGVPGGRGQRIAPGDPGHSALVQRMESRHPLRQMPPLGSERVDREAVALIRAWIAEDLPAVHD